MRILFIHNYYQQRGGEDIIFEQEVAMLREAGSIVETVEFTNDGFDGSLLGTVTGAALSLYSSQSARRVEQAIDRFKPDVVHIHNLFYTATPSVIQAVKRRNIPVVMTLHNYRLVCASGMLMREGEVPCERCLTKTIPLDGIRFGCFRDSRLQSTQLTAITSLHKLTGVWRMVDRFIVLTEFARAKMLQSSLGLRPDQVVVKPNAVPDLGYADPAQREDYFLYIGRLSPEKGIHTLLAAFGATSQRLKILGDGPLKADVEKAVQQHQTIQFLGHQPRAAVVEQLKKCRALVVPSIWYEGLPTVILEAFATGTPIIYADQANLRSIVGDYGTRFLPGDAASLRQVIHEVSSGKLSDNTAQAIRGQYETQYTSAEIAHKQLFIYKNVSPAKMANEYVI
ncbi:glycosyltransferase involved in cell wall biosynthesis [Spirosoma lacussanchae]|uniref:glycosyltransferase n=1 Tax=Spirosoma lacussanchae TaxID=1884249 RepID=UPI0011092620|nr:glycosyltransferase [Spirosoma lacussanchae]